MLQCDRQLVIINLRNFDNIRFVWDKLKHSKKIQAKFGFFLNFSDWAGVQFKLKKVGNLCEVSVTALEPLCKYCERHAGKKTLHLNGFNVNNCWASFMPKFHTF